jgi:hypothetical protein
MNEKKLNYLKKCGLKNDQHTQSPMVEHVFKIQRKKMGQLGSNRLLEII